MHPVEFTKYAVMFGIAFLPYTIVSATFGTTLLVFVIKYYQNSSARYMLHLLGFSLFVAILSMILLLPIIHWLVTDLNLREVVSVFAIALALSSFEICRKMSFARGRDLSLMFAAPSGVVLYAVLLYVIISQGRLSAAAAITAMAISLFITTLIYLIFLMPRLTTIDKPTIGNVFYRHIHYGIWPLMGTLGYWSATQGFLLLAAIKLTASDFQSFRALLNLTSAFAVALMVIELVATSRLSSTLLNEGLPNFHSRVRRLYAQGSLPAVAFFAIGSIGLFGVSHYLYPTAAQVEAFILPALVVYQFILAMNKPAAMGLRVIEVTRPFFIGHWLSAIVALACGFFLMQFWGIHGAAVAMVMSAFALTITLALCFAAAEPKSGGVIELGS